MTLDLRAALCQTPLLDGVPSDLLDRLIDQGTVRQVRAGEQLFAASDMSNTVFFILAGSLRIYSRDETSPVPLADLGAGDVVGELAAIDGGGRTGSATALQESAVLVCPPDAFIALLSQGPQVALRLLRRFSRIIRDADSHIAALSNLAPGQRVYFALLHLAAPDPSGSGQWTINPAPSHKEVAGWAGTTEEVVATALGSLMRSGLIRRRSLELQIFDRQRLEDLIRQR